MDELDSDLQDSATWPAEIFEKILDCIDSATFMRCSVIDSKNIVDDAIPNQSMQKYGKTPLSLARIGGALR